MPFDGHALAAALIQAEIMIDRVIEKWTPTFGQYFLNLRCGVSGVHLVDQKRISRSLMKLLRRV